MNRVTALAKSIRAAFPGGSVKIDKPDRPTGDWFVDVENAGRCFTIIYRPKLGFGLSSTPTEGYGEGPDEVFGLDAKAVMERLRELVSTGRRTAPQRVRVLQELRETVCLTQVELARRLGIKQPSVSKMERGRDTTLASLRRYVKALGGELQVTARFVGPEGELKVEFDPRRKSSPSQQGRTLTARHRKAV